MATTYLDRANIYWKQANELLEKRGWSKASELAWGSVVEVIHALAESQGTKIKNHGALRDFIRTVAQQLQDNEIWRLFQKAEGFHANFYYEFMDEQEVKEIFPFIKEFLEKLGRLLPPRT
ncbi:MAG: hypothetical protein HY671_00255 [Chloroflexi bacterium]|nr:hypothetical protein [Chloroflexota bacterium]